MRLFCRICIILFLKRTCNNHFFDLLLCYLYYIKNAELRVAFQKEIFIFVMYFFVNYLIPRDMVLRG